MPSRGNDNRNAFGVLRTFGQPVFPLAGWLFRVRPYAGGRFAIGCGWLIWVRLEGRPLHNPPPHRVRSWHRLFLKLSC